MSKNSNLVSFCVLMFAGIFLSVLLKNEVVWDLANYHYYNAYAFLHDRTQLDTVPAEIQTFFNPIMDLPLYFYIKYFNDSPTTLYALQGLWCGLFLFVLYKICLLFFAEKNKYFLSFLVLTLTVTAQATFCQIGSSSNEVSVAFFILWGFYLLLKMIKAPNKQSIKTFFVAGLIMGIGLGLKQTVITYCVASGLTLMICFKYLKDPLKSIAVFALGGFLGYMLINGWFMYKNWALYSNPFFPFLNGLFHSPYFTDNNFRDTHFLPSAAKFFIFPFIWNIEPTSISEHPYRDVRLTLYYILPLAVLFYLLIKNKLKSFWAEQRLRTATYIFCFSSFLIWMGVFSIMRYTVVVEAIGALLLTDLLNYAQKNKIIFALLGTIMFGLVISVFFHTSFGHIYGKHIELQKISLPENTLIKIYGKPTSFIIPILAQEKNIKTVSYYQPDSCFTEQGAFLEKRNKMEKEHKGPIVYIYQEKSFKIFQTEEQLEQDYHNNQNLCKRAFLFGLIKDEDACIAESLRKYKKSIQDMKASEKYISKEDIKRHTCKKLENNLDSGIYICVPKTLQAQIFTSEKSR